MIDTAKLHLRPYTLDDYEPHRAMFADPVFMRYIGGQPLSAEDSWNRVLRVCGHWTLLGYGLFAVIERATGQYVGETGIADFHRAIGNGFDDAVEAAWAVHPSSQGRGYAFEAVSAAHDWFARARGSPRTVCLINPDNLSSLRLAAKLGYEAFGEAEYRGSSSIMLERRVAGRTAEETGPVPAA